MRPLSTNESNVVFSVIDVETTITDGTADPFHPDNHAVLVGACTFFAESTTGIALCRPVPDKEHEFNISGIDEAPIMVTHNGKFDLHYVRKHIPSDNFQELLSIPFWDTQIAEYVLTAQQHQWASLDELSEKYGLKSKADEGFADIKDAFERGIGADKIEQKHLANYLGHDLQVTGGIAYQQMAAATQEQFDLILTMGEAMKAVQEMEWNGMHHDSEVNDDLSIGMGDSIRTLAKDMDEVLVTIFDDPEKASELLVDKPDWFNSPHVISALLFGGEIKWKRREAIGVYKTGAKKGKVRYRVHHESIKLVRCLDPDDMDSTETKKKGTYTTDETVLKNVTHGPPHRGHLAKSLLEYKKLNKLLTTYLTNFKEMEVEGIIHHQLNQCATATGRLSSSKPNLQNVPMPDKDPSLNVKRCFTSRYGKDGVILEIDFKQLEVCVLAWLTQDAQLIKDIEDGVDIHSTVGAKIYGPHMNKAQRRNVKAVVFAMIYGAGAKGIAKSSGVPLNEVKGIMASFYDRYTDIQPYYEVQMADMDRVKDVVYRDKNGDLSHWFEISMPHGRTYWCHEDPYRFGPKYTEMRNYPVQGTATGDIVPAILGKVREIVADERAVKLVTTTHDSMTFDCEDREAAINLCRYLHTALFAEPAMDEFLARTFKGLEFNVPLTLEYEMGPSWGEMKEFDIFA